MKRSGQQKPLDGGAARLFSGSDEIHAAGRVFDWSSSSLGPVDSWPDSLWSTVRLCLDSHFPMAVLAGPELLLMYNKGYLSVLGAGRHPWAFGRPKREVWAELWELLAPEFERAIRDGESSFHQGAPFVLERNGQKEERYFNYSFIPIRDHDGKTLGVLNVLQETTDTILIERDLRRTFELSHDLLAVMGTDDRYRRISSSFTRMLGWSQRELLDRPGSFFVHPEDLEKTARELKNLAEGQPTIKFENRYRHKNGSYRWLSWEAAPVPAEGLIYAAGRDVTERKKVEEALQESERRLAEEAGVLARLHDLNTRLWSVSDLREGLDEILNATIDLVGADKGIIQMNHNNVLRMVAQQGFKQDFIEQFREISVADDTACSRAMRTGKIIIIEDVEKDEDFAPQRHIARLANYRAVLSAPMFGRDGRALGIVSTHFKLPYQPKQQSLRQLDLYIRQAADLIERKQAEQALRESEERYRNLIRIMPAPVALHLGTDHRFTIVSDAFRAICGGRALTGLTPGEAFPEAVGCGIFPDCLDEVVATGQPWISSETPASFDRGKGEGESWFNIRYEPVRDADGRVIGVLNFCIDVTDQVRARRELERLLERQAFLVRLSDALRPLADTTQIQRNASRLLAEHLGVDRVMYAEVDGPSGDSFVIRDGYRRSDMSPAAREHRFEDYGDYVIPALRGGKTLAVADVTEVPEHTSKHLTAYQSVDIRAYMVVPLVKDDRLVAYMVVNQRLSREWTWDEVELVEETAERTWQAVERAKAEIALQRSEAFHRLAVEAGRVGTWDLDMATGECRVSPKMAELLDFSSDRQTISKEQWVEAVYQDDREDMRAAIEVSVKRGVPFDFTFRVVTDHDVRWLYSCGDAWRDESRKTVHLRGASIDVTERKQTEEALRESEERLRLALDAAGMGSFVWHAASHRTEADNQMFALFRLPPNETFSPESPPSSIHPVDRKRYAAAVSRAVDPAGRGELSQEIRVIHPDGKARWLSIRARTAFAGEPPRAVRVAGVAADINDRKQAEQELRRLNARLRESDRRKDEFIAMLGHELRNPLAAIRNATDLMKLFALDEDARLLRSYEVLDRQLEHMTRLVDGLLEVSRIARGKIYLNCDVLDLRLIIDAIVQDHSGQIECKGLALDYVFSSAPIWVNADHVRLAQVFDNLLGNAIKFTDSPGGISVTLEQRDGFATVQVSDTGMGIRPEMLERLFEPFQQETQEIARAAGGLGLGLALAKGLVELHGGSIVARSEGPGSGAEFEVCLPLASPPIVERRPEGKTDFEFRRILIVEDNPDARQTLHDLLGMLGHDVSSVGNGAEAIDVLRADHVDVVLCDLGLPGMSGYDVARTIRANADLQKIRLIALTGYGQPEDRKQSAHAGFDDHLTKPVNLEELNRALRK